MKINKTKITLTTRGSLVGQQIYTIAQLEGAAQVTPLNTNQFYRVGDNLGQAMADKLCDVARYNVVIKLITE